MFNKFFLLSLFLLTPPLWATNDNEHAHHQHMPLMIPDDAAVPSVQLSITQDSKSGWNLSLELDNFRFAPENLDKTESYTYQEGHAHLYVNGNKITRLYSPWYYFPRLVPGEYEITVTLNTNGHQDLMYQTQRIESTVQLTVQ